MKLWGRHKSWLKWLLAGLLVSLVGFAGWVYGVEFPESSLDPAPITSTRVLDRRGNQLREVLGDGDRRARWLPLEEISSDLVLATIHAEDKRFHDHVGVDPTAIVRSVYYNLRRQKLVTGASTITQQTVKLVMPRGRRDVAAKAMEAVWALRLERSLTKAEILEQYLNRAPYGNQRFGAEAAARTYFGKPAGQLSLAEATLLAGLPQAPTSLNPYRHLQRAKLRQEALLRQMHRRGAISDADLHRALGEKVVLSPKEGLLRAPHFTDHVLRRFPATEPLPEEIRTTIDLEMQQRVEGIVRAQLDKVADRDVSQGAALVLDTRSGDVLAWVGSRDYFDVASLGGNDGVTARRQPGSTLKPFVYGMYLERGGTPADMLADLPTQFPTMDGVYIPQNYNRKHHGPVSVRDALGNSLNIPVIAVTAELGPEKVLERLRLAGLSTLTEDADHYGLGISLGDGDVRLLDLANAYAALGRLGTWRPIRTIQSDPKPPRCSERRILEKVAAYQILDILTDDKARSLSFGRDGVLHLPYRVAVKTGTSTHYRDSWAVGVTPDYTVAAWAGNFDGSPTNRVSGAAAAAPILRYVFQSLYPKASEPADVAWYRAPAGVERREVCALSGQPAGNHCPTKRLELLAHDHQGASGQPGPDGHRSHGATRCQIHRAVLVDSRNGLRAGPGCDFAHLQTRVFHVLPPAWLEWGTERGLTGPPTDWSPLCPGTAVDPASPHPGAHVRIAHPLDGDEFLLGSVQHEDARSITLRALNADPTVTSLTWYVNGERLDAVSAPYALRWRLRPGTHRIGLGRSSLETEVEIQVH